MRRKLTAHSSVPTLQLSLQGIRLRFGLTAAGRRLKNPWLCVSLRLLSLAFPHPPIVHEIKLDGFRMMVRRDPAGVRLITRNGHDWSGRFPLIAAAAGTLRARSFLIDGEAVACDGDGLPEFDRLRYRRQDGRVFLFAFDLIELNGRDMRREPLEVRKRALAAVLRSKARAGIQFNDHCDDLPAEVVFRHACKLGFEGIVSKRLGSPYRSGRSRDWLKMKNPNAPAVKREAEEDWGRLLSNT
jgi:bifunctional non-homologous end joining protein LigD